MKRIITIEINARNRDAIYLFTYRMQVMLEDMKSSGRIKEYEITISEPKQPKICPLRALAYTIAGIPAKVQEPVCIGPRCAWFIPTDEGLEECAVKRFTWP